MKPQVSTDPKIQRIPGCSTPKEKTLGYEDIPCRPVFLCFFLKKVISKENRIGYNLHGRDRGRTGNQRGTITKKSLIATQEIILKTGGQMV